MKWAFTENGFDIFHWDRLRGLLGSLLLTIVQFFCIGVYFLENVFWILIRGVKMKDGSYKNLIDGLLFNNQALADNQITKITGVIILIAIALTIIASVVAIIKSQFSTKDEDKSPKIAVLGVVKAIVLMVTFPLMVYILLLVTNTLTNAVCEYAHFDNTDNNSLANQLFFMFMNPEGRSNCMNADGTARFSFTLENLSSLGFPGDNTWEQLKSSGFINGANEEGLFGYDYLLAIVVMIILVFALFKAILLLIRRIFDIVVLYVIAPLPIACYPSDEGKRFDIWKDLMASKIVSSFGLAITFIVYSILITVIYDTLAAWSQASGSTLTRTLNIAIVNGQIDTGTLLGVVYLFVIISGALALPNMYSLLATLVSSQAGMVAQHDLQNMANDMAFFQRGAHQAEKMALGSTGLMLRALKTGAFGSRDARYLNAMRKRNGQDEKAGKLTNTAWNMASRGIIGGIALGAGEAFSNRKSDRISKKADNIRNSAINNFDDKLHLSIANSQLRDMGQREVTYRDVLQSETDKRGTIKADEIARRRKEPPKDDKK